MAEHSEPLCLICGNNHPARTKDSGTHDGGCPAIREAASAGARPRNVPPSVYSGYLNARAALRADVPGTATRLLQDVLSDIAEERGVPQAHTFPRKLDALCDKGIITRRVRDSLTRATAVSGASQEQAWALMTVVESALYRLYLHPASP